MIITNSNYFVTSIKYTRIFVHQLLIYQYMKLKEVILFQIEKTSKAARKYSQAAFDDKKIDITVDQWVLLKVIEENEGASQKEIAEYAVKDGASVTRILDLLEKKQLVMREPIQNNRRQYAIHLSEKGRIFIDAHIDLISQHRAKSLDGFAQSEIDQLHSFLIRIQQNMR